jgi:AMP-polyphosphate phosphotransferase
VGRVILKAIGDRMVLESEAAPKTLAPPLLPPNDDLHLLNSLDMEQSLNKATYKI